MCALKNTLFMYTAFLDCQKPIDKIALVTRPICGLLSKATTLERYDERRLMLRKHVRRHATYAISGIHSGDKSKEHLVAGLKGLGYGMLGGLTSIVTETYDGVAHEGITGFFTGLGWGLVGTIR